MIIHIANVESYYGEANGLTIYEESYINLKNILINNINAGTQFENEDIMNELVILPNLIPPACPVDIHDNTIINYIDGEVIDNIIFNDIYGFEICDQFNTNMVDDDNSDNIINESIMVIVLSIMLIVISYI